MCDTRMCQIQEREPRRSLFISVRKRKRKSTSGQETMCSAAHMQALHRNDESEKSRKLTRNDEICRTLQRPNKSRGRMRASSSCDEKEARSQQQQQKVASKLKVDDKKVLLSQSTSYLEPFLILLTALVALTSTQITSGLAAQQQHQQQQQQLPTVIVRGFLNYRTTVDGTVLLFTPDAGQQQSATASVSIQTTATAQQQVAPTKQLSSNLVFVEPTSVVLSANTPLQTTSHHLDSRPRSNSLTEVAASASESPATAAQANEWRPTQATPPLRMPTSDTAQKQTDEQTPRPSVQADDITDTPTTSSTSRSEPELAAPSSPTTPESTQTRPKRPSLGTFGSQGLRPRVPGTAGATSPSLQSRARDMPSPGAANSPNGSINGIRRPGLSPSGAFSSASSSAAVTPSGPNATPSDPAALANASNAFQNRLASANTRLKNRFKHRQQGSQATAPAQQQSPSAPPVAPQTSSNSLIAPESLLDVASSIEQPTSAARSSALAPSGTSGQLGSSGPAVGSDEVLLPVAASSAASAEAAESSRSGATGSNSDLGDIPQPLEQQQPKVAALEELQQPDAGNAPPVVVASSTAATSGENTGDPLALEPMSAEQQAGSASLSRAGELQPKVLSGQLQQGSLSSGGSLLNLDEVFQSDQPLLSSSESSAPASHSAPPTTTTTHKHALGPHARAKPHQPHTHQPRNGSHNNDKLNGWLGQHHNKFVPRPASKQPKEGAEEAGHLSHALAANLNQLLPAQAPHHHHHQTPAPPVTSASGANSTAPLPVVVAASEPQVGGALSVNGSTLAASSGNSSSQAVLPAANATNQDAIVPMQTLTRTYSTLLETSKTRLVPLQLKSSTAIYTITEDYVMTKVMTAYQTMPAGAEFILAEPLSTRAPYDVFASADSSEAPSGAKTNSEIVAPPVAGSSGGGREVAAPIDITQEQPITLDTSPKSANNWLHDFSNPLDGAGGDQLGNQFQSSSQQQTAMMALLEQQANNGNNGAQQTNLMAQLLDGSNSAAMLNGEPLDQLASQLDPAALLADGTINIPDLNNPLVLAAAIQNPQLAAVILAAQQLKLKQRQQQQQLRPNLNNLNNNNNNNLIVPQQFQQLQPSFSTSFSTTVRPSTYTARDTMYTTRLVSFRDGRTVRTRTVSEPGSVIEQTLTTIVTETIPITITIKPTGVASLVPSTAAPFGGNQIAAAASQQQQQQSNQATINNALFATQLANILARRQQATLQTSFQNPSLMNLGGGSQNPAGAAATPQQLLALQQLFAQQKRQQSQQQQQQQQFQPNFQQLLQSINQQQQQQQQQPGTLNATNSNPQVSPPIQAAATHEPASHKLDQQQQQQQVVATPALQKAPKAITSSALSMTNPAAMILTNNNGQPLTTTLTSLQIRTYTVHNAFKTIFRTITSTVLIPTVLSPGASLLPTFN